ncbi:hypothetical protein [Sphingosinithalassobacter portus]|uniref:hypothetical protein n=1 Tax=Stakelama portus TaxID=2676234 RepID=UPI000D6E6BA0|nr:hypothetical protein [Sphingosinithalassobacter portus]
MVRYFLAVALMLPVATAGSATRFTTQQYTTQIATDDPCCMLAANTIVEIEITQPVGSKISKTLDAFTFRVAEPVMVDGQIVIPMGAEGVGEVVHAAHAGFGGRAGELILAARYIELGPVHVPLRRFRYGSSHGESHESTATLAALAVSPVLGLLITGKEITLTPGTRAHASVASDTRLPAVAAENDSPPAGEAIPESENRANDERPAEAG